jgi:hypothetical protein
VILANLQQHFAATDTDLVVDLLANGDPGQRHALERLALQDGIQPLLDDPALPERLRDPGTAAPSQALLLYVLTRDNLRLVGLDDVRLTEYVGALLFEFGIRDRAHRIASYDGVAYHYVTDILTHVESERGRRGFLLRAHLGNFTLWLAGLFPDYVTARVHRKGGPDFRFYEELGARGFWMASNHQLARQYDLVDVYRCAADSFGRLRVALNQLSDRVFFPNVSGPDRLLRQVRDNFLSDA